MPETKTEQQKSDFGQGLCYCLGLFLGHAEGLRNQIHEYAKLRIADGTTHPNLFTEEHAVQLWFYGASDHVFDLIPDSALGHLVTRVLTLKNKCLEWRLPFSESNNPTLDNAHWAIQEAKNLLREIDAHHGVPVIKGSWE